MYILTLMRKSFLFTLLLITLGLVKVFAHDQCPPALSSPSNKKIEEISDESQDIMLMASLIASQLQLSSLSKSSPIQINSTMMFLGAITGVKIDGTDRGIFYNFSLINRTLFTAFKRLGILKDLQFFLLDQLGLNENDLGPFKIRSKGGGLTLHLNKPPTAFTVIDFYYDETISAMIDRSRQNKTIKNTQKGSSQGFSILPEHFLLAALELNTPLRAFLLKALKIKDVMEVMEIRFLIHSLFDNARQSAKPSRGLFKFLLERKAIVEKAIQLREQENTTILEASRELGIGRKALLQWLDEYEKEYGFTSGKKRWPQTPYPHEEKKIIISKTISLIQEGVSLSEAAKRLGVKEMTLWKWFNEHEQKYGPIRGRKRWFRTSYSPEQKKMVIQNAILLIQKGMAIEKIANNLKIDRHVLPQWLDEHEQENGPIIKRQRSPRMIYSPEQKNEAIQKVIQWFREEEDMTISEAARRLKMKRETLQKWLDRYEQKHGLIRGRKRPKNRGPVYPQEEREKIIQETVLLIQEGTTVSKAAKKLEVTEGTLRTWLDEYEMENGPIRSRQRWDHKTYFQEDRDEIIQKAIPLLEQENMTISEVARRLNVNRVTLKRWLNKYGQKYGFMNKKQNHPYTIYFQEEKITIESIDH